MCLLFFSFSQDVWIVNFYFLLFYHQQCICLASTGSYNKLKMTHLKMGKWILIVCQQTLYHYLLVKMVSAHLNFYFAVVLRHHPLKDLSSDNSFFLFYIHWICQYNLQWQVRLLPQFQVAQMLLNLMVVKSHKMTALLSCVCTALLPVRSSCRVVLVEHSLPILLSYCPLQPTEAPPYYSFVSM